MASNEIPEQYNPLVALAEDAADGANKHEATLGLKQNTEAAIRADLAALNGAQNTFSQKRTAKSNAVAANKTADSNGKAFIALFIQLEKPRLGDWGPLWDEAGFSAGSISMPSTQDDRFVLLGSLKTFLTNHANYEVKDAAKPELDVTAAVADALYTACLNGRNGVNDASVGSGLALVARDAALDALRARLIGLRSELVQLKLPDDSPLWYAFGFNAPADPETPGQPTALALTGVAGIGTLIVDWEPARRATGYRVKVQVAGEAQPRMFGIFPDDQTTLTQLPLGKALTVSVIAHNEAGDGPESAPMVTTLA